MKKTRRTVRASEKIITARQLDEQMSELLLHREKVAQAELLSQRPKRGGTRRTGSFLNHSIGAWLYR